MATIGLDTYSSTNTAGPVATSVFQPPPVTSSPAPSYSGGTKNTPDQIMSAGQTLLGRALTDVTPWLNDPNFYSNIAASQEAKNYAARPKPTTPTGGGGDPASYIAQFQASHGADASLTDLIAYLNQQGIAASPYMYGSTPSGNEITLNGQQYKVKTGDNANWWNPSMGEGASGGSGNVFSDPATAGWESLLRQVTSQLSTPTQTPDYQNLVDYLKSYGQQLQGPAYTPSQSELIQTQALDPLTQQRDAQEQQILQWASAHGLDPKSGPVLQQLQDLNQKYQQARTQVQSGFATNAIGFEKQQQAQAAQIGQILQTLEQGQQTGNEARALQAVSLMGQLPALADTRLAAANQTLSANSASLNPLLQYFLNQQQLQDQQGRFDAGQSADYWKQIGQLLGQLFT